MLCSGGTTFLQYPSLFVSLPKVCTVSLRFTWTIRTLTSFLANIKVKHCVEAHVNTRPFCVNFFTKLMILPPPWHQYHHVLGCPPPPPKENTVRPVLVVLWRAPIYQNMDVCAEAEFLYVIRTEDLRVFLLAFPVNSTTGFYYPPPIWAKVVWKTATLEAVVYLSFI